ncbi:hypothetical protein MMG00_02435 [Ignatzschineria rhizosphaerae]|uniref:Gp5/Type VI secretion system Vgr protein OB-fold domain-containing protein n=1 Tax=Ignatzschineria rhizosphaerae TaxID=2923279 RepID=A0ABY3X1H5_9GAMM|nr:hypothetical protein [Ignatzschineria rhizosphaerae]UNM96732.1 hypothetical protein MMG00_02435 [Ignatzschineria rhizosphaerae]
MQLPTDSLRKTNEVFKTGEVIGIRVTSGIIEVQCEFEDDAKTPWMPYALPFVGGTSIFCYPRIGQGGRVMSEGGENNINVFIPNLDTSQQFAGLGEFDFKILFENGDFIHHNSGNLTINSASTVVVNTQDATVNAEKTTVNSSNTTTNTDQFTVNAPTINLNGNVFIAGGISAGGGAGRNVVRAVFNYPVVFQAHAQANNDITINGISFIGHKHDTPEGMSDVPEGAK